MALMETVLPTYPQNIHWIADEDCYSADVDQLLQQVRQQASIHGLTIQTLGYIGRDPLLLLSPERAVVGPRLLIAAGFHGEEPAGCWGILRFLRREAGLLAQANVSFLPLVNPTGLRRGSRKNNQGENPNQDYCHTESGRPEPSTEGRILLAHLDELKYLARDGFVSLHEDIDMEECWKQYRMQDLVDRVDEQLATLEQMFDWIEESRREQQNAKVGIAAVLLAIVSITAVAAQLISTIDVYSELGATERLLFILLGFALGTLGTLAVYRLPLSRRRRHRR